MRDYRDPNTGAWLADKEIADQFPDYIVEPWISWKSRGWAHIKKNSWGVPVYALSENKPYGSENIPANRLLAISHGNIPDLPDDFGPWIGRRIFESSGPFILGHTYRVWAGMYGERPGRYPAHVRHYEAEFVGVNDGMDSFKVLNDLSKNVAADKTGAPPLPNLVGKVLGYEHNSPRRALNEERENPIRTWYLGPKQAG